jgi:hypothetical protein
LPYRVSEPLKPSIFGDNIFINFIDINEDRLSTDLYHQPRLQEKIVPEATTNIMAPHAVPKQHRHKRIIRLLIGMACLVLDE